MARYCRWVNFHFRCMSSSANIPLCTQPFFLVYIYPIGNLISLIVSWNRRKSNGIRESNLFNEIFSPIGYCIFEHSITYPNLTWSKNQSFRAKTYGALLDWPFRGKTILSLSLSLFVFVKEKKKGRLLEKEKKGGRWERELCEIWRSMSRKMKSWVRVKDEIDWRGRGKWERAEDKRRWGKF